MSHPIFKTALAAATALSIGLTAAPALAWGDREQGIVTGIAGTLLYQHVQREGRDHRQPPRYQDDDGYYERPAYGYRPAPPPREYYQPQRVSVYQTTLGQAFKSYSSSERRDIQRELRSLGYYDGRVDGSFGPGTYEAVNAYARRSGQPGATRSMAAAYGVYDSLLY
jgi:peptidoglycan hydrolase-like protein with peptidoglycan-binding domain